MLPPLLAVLCCCAGAAKGQLAEEVLGLVQDFVPSIVKAQRARQAPADVQPDRREFDFVVVGAGPAGCALASRLTEGGQWSVLLLEEGEEEVPLMRVPLLAMHLAATDAAWNYTTVPQNTSCAALEEGRCDYAQGRALGGGSAINYMYSLRGNARDFDAWAALGNDGWGSRDMQPYFKKMERGASEAGGGVPSSPPPLRSALGAALERAAREAGVGATRPPAATRRGERWSAARAYLPPPVRRRHNLLIRPGAFVTRILFGQGRRARGVTYRRNGRDVEALASKEVIVSGGAVNSPALLLRSGVGPREHLQRLGVNVVRDLPVGLNLADAAAFPFLLVAVNSSLAPSLPQMMFDPNTYTDYLLRREGPLAMPSTVEVATFHDLEGTRFHSPSRPLVEVVYSTAPPAVNARGVQQFRIKRDTFNTMLAPLKNTPMFQATLWRLRPESRGCVYLRDADPSSPPAIDPMALSHPADVDATLAGIRDIQRLLESPSLRRLGARLVRAPLPGCDAEAFDSDAYWRCALRRHSITTYRPSGTCKMAPKGDATGVVTPDLKVKGMSGLRVADSSIIPVMVSGDLQTTAYVIGEKAADLIKAEHSRNANDLSDQIKQSSDNFKVTAAYVFQNSAWRPMIRPK